MDKNLNPRRWENEAACIGVDTELFFPPRIKTVYAEMADQAKAYCNGDRALKRKPCPVREQCREWAIQTDELFGIFGGMSHRERNALLRKRHREALEGGPACHETCAICLGVEYEDTDE